MYLDVDPTCDKCKGTSASLHHMYSTCPSLDNFWTSIFHALSKFLPHQIEPNPWIGIFGIALDRNLPKSRLHFLACASLLARHSISLKCKDPAPPSYSHWLRDKISCMSLEKIRYTIQGLENKFYKIWHHFLLFYEESFFNSGFTLIRYIGLDGAFK